MVLFSSNTELTEYSQKRRWTEPRGNRLHGFPFLLVDEAEEVLLGASSLVLPEDAVFTAGTQSTTQTI